MWTGFTLARLLLLQHIRLIHVSVCTVQKNAVGFGPASAKSGVLEIGLPLRVGAPKITAGQVRCLCCWAATRRVLAFGQRLDMRYYTEASAVAILSTCVPCLQGQVAVRINQTRMQWPAATNPLSVREYAVRLEQIVNNAAQLVSTTTVPAVNAGRDVIFGGLAAGRYRVSNGCNHRALRG